MNNQSLLGNLSMIERVWGGIANSSSKKDIFKLPEIYKDSKVIKKGVSFYAKKSKKRS